MISTQIEATRAYAEEYLANGISILPLRVDGSKAPALSSTKDYQTRYATHSEVESWFRQPAGIGIVCGAISGGLEVIDFDMPQLLWPLLAMLPSKLVSMLGIYETPGGWHLAYRCGVVCGNRKLAVWESPSSRSQVDNGHRECTGLKSIGKGVRIETRGEGGYIVGEGSPVATHKLNLPYCHYSGPRMIELQPIEKLDRDLIWKSAMSFCCEREKLIARTALKMAKSKLFMAKPRDEQEPWTWYDLFGSWDEILVGWTRHGNKLTRPGKDFGVSAAISENESGEDILTVFSSSSELGPSLGEQHRSWGKFNALVAARFGGDRKEATRHVANLMRQVHD